MSNAEHNAEDLEGHGRYTPAPSEILGDDTEGHRPSPRHDAPLDDAEGHGRRGIPAPSEILDDDAEGHGRRGMPAPSEILDDDAEGHGRMAKP